MHADTEADLHSPVLRGFLCAHVGRIFQLQNDPTDRPLVSDLAQYKELLWLERHSYLPVVTLALLAWLIADWPGVIVGFCWSTVAVACDVQRQLAVSPYRPTALYHRRSVRE
jgi:stearoyl-CoA desaturase (delta-9 desaturase)